MIKNFVSQTEINLENRPGFNYGVEMLFGGTLYRGLGTNLVVSEQGHSVSISGRNERDINRKRKLLANSLGAVLMEGSSQ